MRTEYHCHILPGIDDGAHNPEMSLEMLEMMRMQGIERVVATPHFYAHREKSVEDFLEKRKNAYNRIKENKFIKNIILGAEVAIEHGISEMKDIEKLVIMGTNLIMLELPYRSYEKWISEEIYNISAEYNLKVIIAHVHRYFEYYSSSEIERILSIKPVFQVNNEAFENRKEKRFIKNLINDEKEIVFGSDAHNLTSRKPNWDLLQKKVDVSIIETSDKMLERYANYMAVYV